jgi:hypothetical protein
MFKNRIIEEYLLYQDTILNIAARMSYIMKWGDI